MLSLLLVALLAPQGCPTSQVDGAKISFCHGVGGMFAASGTVVFSNEAP